MFRKKGVARVWADPAPDFDPGLELAITPNQALNEGWRPSGGYWYTLALKVGPEVARDKLVSNWNVAALVSALFTTLTMPVVTAPAYGGHNADDDERSNVAVQVFIVCFHCSLILSFFVIMGTLAMLATIDLCVNESELLHYIAKFHVFHEILYIAFAVSFLCMIAGVLSLAYYNYGQVVFAVIISVYLSLAVMETIYAVRLDVLTKGRLVMHRIKLEQIGKYFDPFLAQPKEQQQGQGASGHHKHDKQQRGASTKRPAGLEAEDGRDDVGRPHPHGEAGERGEQDVARMMRQDSSRREGDH